MATFPQKNSFKARISTIFIKTLQNFIYKTHCWFEKCTKVLDQKKKGKNLKDVKLAHKLDEQNLSILTTTLHKLDEQNLSISTTNRYTQ